MAGLQRNHAFDDFERVGVDDLVGPLAARAQHVEGGDGALLGFEEDVKSPVAGFTAGAHYSLTLPR